MNEIFHLNDLLPVLHLICPIFFFLTYTKNKVGAGIQEVHLLPFNPTDKPLTFINSEGKMHRVSRGAPEQVS